MEETACEGEGGGYVQTASIRPHVGMGKLPTTKEKEVASM